MKVLTQCVIDNKCTPSSYYAGGCIETHCANQLYCYYSCYLGELDITQEQKNCADYVDRCNAINSSSTKLSALAVFALFAIVATFL